MAKKMKDPKYGTGMDRRAWTARQRLWRRQAAILHRTERVSPAIPATPDSTWKLFPEVQASCSDPDQDCERLGNVREQEWPCVACGFFVKPIYKDNEDLSVAEELVMTDAKRVKAGSKEPDPELATREMALARVKAAKAARE